MFRRYIGFPPSRSPSGAAETVHRVTGLPRHLFDWSIYSPTPLGFRMGIPRRELGIISCCCMSCSVCGYTHRLFVSRDPGKASCYTSALLHQQDKTRSIRSHVFACLVVLRAELLHSAVLPGRQRSIGYRKRSEFAASRSGLCHCEHGKRVHHFSHKEVSHVGSSSIVVRT